MNAIDPRIIRFVDEILLPRRSPAPGVPPELRPVPDSTDEWSDWIAIGSPVTDAELAEVQADFNVELPQLYLDYFRYKQIYDGDQGLIRFPDMRPPDPLSHLKQTLSLHRDFFAQTNRQRYVPFADDGNDGGPLCFNMDEPTQDRDFAVYFVDHELFRDTSYVGERWYKSFADVLLAVERDRLSYDQGGE